MAARWAVPLDRIPDGEDPWGYGTPSLKYRITDALAGIYLGVHTAASAIVEGPRPEKPGAAFQVDQVAGLLALREGKIEEGLVLLSRAAETEDALPVEYAPPEPVTPAHELLGESLRHLCVRFYP